MTNVRFLTLGDSAIAVEFGQEIRLDVNRQVTALQKLMEENPVAGVVEMVPNYCSLMIVYNPLAVGYHELKLAVEKLLDRLAAVSEAEKEVIEIPVIYGGEYGPDLTEVAAAHNMTEAEVIRRHAEPEYPIYMLGFVAGFPYLGGMDEAIATPRKQSPRLKIPAGSVGIAGGQTGIYSVESPGGWQIIGRTPLKLYDPEQEEPILLRAGQYVKFRPISEAEYKEMGK